MGKWCCGEAASGLSRGAGKKGQLHQGGVETCVEQGSCCFGEVLGSAEQAEEEQGPVLVEWRDEVLRVPKHAIVEVSARIELGDAIAWAIETPAEARCGGVCGAAVVVRGHWYDLSLGARVNKEGETYALGDLWPGRVLEQGAVLTGSFSLSSTDTNNATCAGVVFTLDNSTNNSSQSVRMTLQQRGWNCGMEARTPYGRGTVAGWADNVYQIDLGFATAYIPLANTCQPGNRSVKDAQTTVFMRGNADFRVQHMHSPYKYMPPMGLLGVHYVGGSFDWSENAQEKLWGTLTPKDKEVLAEAFRDGFDINKVVDYHAHIVGSGRNGSGCWVTPKMSDPFQSPFGYVKLHVFLSACGITHEDSDAAYENRLIGLVRHMPAFQSMLLAEQSGAKPGETETETETETKTKTKTTPAEPLPLPSDPPVPPTQTQATLVSPTPSRKNALVLLAFDKSYEESGAENLRKTTLHVPNDLSFSIAARNPEHCSSACSVHPYRLDCEQELERCARRGVRVIKWLPNSMLIDPLSPLCDRFYNKVRELDMVILSHAGEEHSVSSAALVNEYGNPLRLRRALDHGCKVIAAHLASEGSAVDLDAVEQQGKAGCFLRCSPREENFKLLLRLFREKKYEGLLFADFSAIIAIMRSKYIEPLLQETSIHGRIVYGSDYPVPCLNFTTVLRQLEFHGLIRSAQSRALRKVYKYNPLLFDVLLKRLVKSKKTGNTLPACAFYEHPELRIHNWKCPSH